MPRFKHTTQKYDERGVKVPKGRDGIKNHNADNPDTMIFDSKSEYELYLELSEQQKQGLISELEYKKVFPIVPKTKWWNNMKERWDVIRELTYITDFVFLRDGKMICMDCKGWKSVTDKATGKVKMQAYYDEIYKIKKKLFLWKYPEYIFEER